METHETSRDGSQKSEMSLEEGIVQVDLLELLSVKDSSQSWVLIGKTGQQMLVDLDKHTIMHRFQIRARDLRILDPNLSYPPAILARERAIVLNLEHIKAIITPEEVLFRGPSAPGVISIVEELQRCLSFGTENDEYPFEFRALELVLKNVCDSLHTRTMELETIYPVLYKLTSKISIGSLDSIRQMKSSLTGLAARVHKVRDQLVHLLDNDGHMGNFYLSRKLAGVSTLLSVSDVPKRHATFTKMGSKIARAKRVYNNGVEELDILLETYFMQIDGTSNRLITLHEYINDTEDYINVQLDCIRNQLIEFELFLSCGGISISVYSLVIGILGMNIPFPWKTKEYMFKWVVIVTGTLSVLLYFIAVGWAKYKRIL